MWTAANWAVLFPDLCQNRKKLSTNTNPTPAVFGADSSVFCLFILCFVCFFQMILFPLLRSEYLTAAFLCFSPPSWASKDVVWSNMLEKDKTYTRDVHLMEKHPHLQPKMRAILLDWLMEVCAPVIFRRVFEISSKDMKFLTNFFFLANCDLVYFESTGGKWLVPNALRKVVAFSP